MLKRMHGRRFARSRLIVKHQSRVVVEAASSELGDEIDDRSALKGCGDGVYFSLKYSISLALLVAEAPMSHTASGAVLRCIENYDGAETIPTASAGAK